jgi:hypothetical protein
LEDIRETGGDLGKIEWVFDETNSMSRPEIVEAAADAIKKPLG